MNFRRYSLYFAWVISLAGLLLSLYYGELRHIEPCRYCWFQRIALFPLALQLGVATYRSDRQFAAIYGIPLCMVGLVAAILQSIIIAFGFHGLCGPGISCLDEVVYFFGVIQFPWLSGMGFIIIAALLWMGRHQFDTT